MREGFQVGARVLVADQVAGERVDHGVGAGATGVGDGDGVEHGQGDGGARAVGEVVGGGGLGQQLAGGGVLAVPQFDAGEQDRRLVRGVPPVAGRGGTQLGAGRVHVPGPVAGQSGPDRGQPHRWRVRIGQRQQRQLDRVGRTGGGVGGHGEAVRALVVAVPAQQVGQGRGGRQPEPGVARVDHRPVGVHRRDPMALGGGEPPQLQLGGQAEVRVLTTGQRGQVVAGQVAVPEVRQPRVLTGGDPGQAGAQAGERAHVVPPAHPQRPLVRLDRVGELAQLVLGQAHAVQCHAEQVEVPGGEHLVVRGARGGQCPRVVRGPHPLGELRERRPVLPVAAVRPRRAVRQRPASCSLRLSVAAGR